MKIKNLFFIYKFFLLINAHSCDYHNTDNFMQNMKMGYYQELLNFQVPIFEIYTLHVTIFIKIIRLYTHAKVYYSFHIFYE